MDIKQYIPHILAVLAFLASGGNVGYYTLSESDRKASVATTSETDSYLLIELHKLEKRVAELEAK